MRISYCSSDVCSSDLVQLQRASHVHAQELFRGVIHALHAFNIDVHAIIPFRFQVITSSFDGFPDDRIGRIFPADGNRSEEHTSELQSLMRNSYAVFCLKKKKP